jgi:ABC-type amino acid transport substrate-binding protein
MLSLKKILFLVILVTAISFSEAMAQEPPASPKKLRVGTEEAPPFAMKNADGAWTGISIELWRQTAGELNIAYEFYELRHHDLLEGIANGSLDVVAATVTITPERLQKMDFTYPFYTTGLGVAVPFKEKNVWLAVIKQLLSFTFLKILLLILTFLLLTGTALWLLERRRNPDHFGGKAVEGIGSGFWFSVVTMTTVGYGDKHVRTMGGRIVAIIWMFIAIVLISFFTATVTSLLTVRILETSVQGLEDLKKAPIGTLAYTSSEAYLKKNLHSFQTYEAVRAGLEAVVRGEIDAFVYDAPLIRHTINQHFRGKLTVLPHTYEHKDYAFALTPNCPMLRSINMVLLQKIREPEWQETLYHYLGR